MTETWDVFLGDQAIGDGYANRQEAIKAARRIARDHGSLPLEVRKVHRAPEPRRCPPSPATGEE